MKCVLDVFTDVRNLQSAMETGKRTDMDSIKIRIPEFRSFLSDVFIYEEEQKDGRILKGLRFKFPIYMNGRNVLGVDWDNESTDDIELEAHLCLILV